MIVYLLTFAAGTFFGAAVIAVLAISKGGNQA